MVTVRRKQGSFGGWLYQVLPEDHPVNLNEPPWYPAVEFCMGIRTAIFAAFLLGFDEDKIHFSHEDWQGFFATANRQQPSERDSYDEWGSY